MTQEFIQRRLCQLPHTGNITIVPGFYKSHEVDYFEISQVKLCDDTWTRVKSLSTNMIWHYPGYIPEYTAANDAAAELYLDELKGAK